LGAQGKINGNLPTRTLEPAFVPGVEQSKISALTEALDDLPALPGADLPMLPPLAASLARVDEVFSIERILSDEGHDRVSQYYKVSELGYRLVHSRAGCMHLGLGAQGDHQAQVRALARTIHATGSRRVLELGSGHGYNLVHLARACPGVEFTGLDLMAHHIRRARRTGVGFRNLQFHLGNFEDLPPEMSGFDLIFAIEALCHAQDLNSVAAAATRALAPGGVIVIFDAVRAAPLLSMSSDMATTVRLYESITAVTKGFRQPEEIRSAFGKAGLTAVHQRDLTLGVIPSVRQIHRYGQRYFDEGGIRLLTRAFPERLRRNAAGALLGPYLVEGVCPGSQPLLEAQRTQGLRYLGAAFMKGHG
jgi:arsenite methyltransferase